MKIKRIRFNSVSTDEGCKCDKCGQWIKNIWTVEFANGMNVNFGIDCFEKMTKEKLNAYGMKQMKSALKRIQMWSEKLQKWSDGEYTEDNCEAWKAEQADWSDSYWKGRSFDEYEEFMINQFIPRRLQDAEEELNKFRNINFNA